MAWSAITINDGQGTPVAHTFTWQQRDSDGWDWFEETSPAPANVVVARRLAVRMKRGSVTGPLESVAKADIRMYSPTGETLAPNSSGITPAPRPAYTRAWRLEASIPERVSGAEATDDEVLFANLLDNAQIKSFLITRRYP